MKHSMLKIVIGTLLCALLVSFAYAAKTRFSPLQYSVTTITNADAQKNVMTALQNFKNKLSFPYTQTEIDHFYDKAPKVVQRALMPYGYFKSEVTDTIEKTAYGWHVTLHIALGPLLPIASVQVEIKGPGKKDHKFLKLLKEIPFHAGDTLQTKDYETFKTDLFNLATKRGYFDAKMQKSAIQINLSTYRANIVIIFDTGPRYIFGDTTFSKSTFHQKFLERFLTYKKGHHYNARKLDKTQEGFVASNLFDQVLIKPDRKATKNHIVPIHIELMPRKAREYTLGAGYGTDTGVRGTAGVVLRQLGGNGHRFHALMRASENNSGITTNYLIPGSNPAHDLFTIGAGASNITQTTGKARNARFGASYALTYGHWKSSLTLAYLTERYNIINLPVTSTTLVYPIIGFKYTNVDHPKHTSRGISFDTQISGADENLLSQTTFFQITSQVSTLYTFEETHTRFLFRTMLGHTNIANLIRLPLSLQLFAGGSRSVRGYDYNSLGPGRNLVTASTEIQQRTIGQWYAVGFVDAGVVGNNNLFHHINVGVGPGVAWITTIGTIELTVANAITQPDKPWTIQFTMGTVL